MCLIDSKALFGLRFFENNSVRCAQRAPKSARHGTPGGGRGRQTCEEQNHASRQRRRHQKWRCESSDDSNCKINCFERRFRYSPRNRFPPQYWTRRLLDHLVYSLAPSLLSSFFTTIVAFSYHKARSKYLRCSSDKALINAQLLHSKQGGYAHICKVFAIMFILLS